MDILYMQDLGHVLGIFTRTSEPGQIETDASAFVGNGLHLRSLTIGQDLVVPPSLVAIFRMDRNWRQIFQPSTLYVSGLPGTPAVTSYPGPSLTLGFTSPNLTIKPATGVAANILVLVLDTAGGLPVQFKTTITAAQTTASVQMTGLISGHTCNAFVFFPTYPIASHSFIAP
jgi:hypothetical protein